MSDEPVFYQPQDEYAVTMLELENITAKPIGVVNSDIELIPDQINMLRIHAVTVGLTSRPDAVKYLRSEVVDEDTDAVSYVYIFYID